MATASRMRWPLVLLVCRPTDSERYCWSVVLALYWINPTAVVEPKHFVTEIQARSDHLDPLKHAVASLCVKLSVRIEVVVAERPLQSKDRIVRWSCCCVPSIRRNALVVVADGKAARESAPVIGQVEVVVVG